MYFVTHGLTYLSKEFTNNMLHQIYKVDTHQVNDSLLVQTDDLYEMCCITDFPESYQQVVHTVHSKPSKQTEGSTQVVLSVCQSEYITV